jgi:hypothetical protein
MGMKQAGVVLSVALVALAAAGCDASRQTQSGLSAPTTSLSAGSSTAPSAGSSTDPITVPSTVAAGSTASTQVVPSDPVVQASVSATSSGCAPKPRVEFVRVSVVLEVNGVYWLKGPEEKLECGPGVPDDVVYTDSGPAQTFQVSNTATYSVPGTSSGQDYSVSAATFMAASQGNDKDQYQWNEGICELELGQDGRVISVADLYMP